MISNKEKTAIIAKLRKENTRLKNKLTKVEAKFNKQWLEINRLTNMLEKYEEIVHALETAANIFDAFREKRQEERELLSEDGYKGYEYEG